MAEAEFTYSAMMSETGAAMMELEATRSGQINGWLQCLAANRSIAHSDLLLNAQGVSRAMGVREEPLWKNSSSQDKEPGQNFCLGARPAIWLVQRYAPEIEDVMLGVYQEKFKGHTQFDIMRQPIKYERDRAEDRARTAVYDYADKGLGAKETQPLVTVLQGWVEKVRTEDLGRIHMRRGFGYIMQLAIDAQWQSEITAVFENPSYDWDAAFNEVLGDQ